MSSEQIAIAVDLGGTRFRVAAIQRDATILARSVRQTDADAHPDVAIADLVEVIAEVRQATAGRPMVGLGVAAPGPVDHVGGVVLQAPNLPRWRDVPLASALGSATGLPVLLGNDANLAALGEARFGAGRGERNLVYLTVSTGIGSGILVDGSLLLGEHGAAAEAGHMTIWWNGRPCHCGNRGCLEAYASGTALAERAHEATAAGRSSLLSSHRGEVDAGAIEKAADQGDALAQELIIDAGTALGIGIRSLLHLFDPALVIIGGGVSRIRARLWETMLGVVSSDTLDLYPKRVRIVPAELGDDPGLLGAAAWVFEKVLGTGAQPGRG